MSGAAAPISPVPWPLIPKKLWGLFPLQPPLRADHEGLDIMAVHGLQLGNSHDAHIRTFTKNEFCWLRDGLNEALAIASLNAVTLGVPLHAFDAASRLDIHDIGILMENLIQQPGEFAADFQGLGIHDRKVVLVAHSLGGLVIKAWLVHLAELSAEEPSDNNLFENFLRSVAGIVFLAVPHKGARLAQLASRFNSSVFIQLLSNKEKLQQLVDEFEPVRKKYNIPICGVYETKEMFKGSRWVPLRKVVSKKSALVHHTQPIPADADHCGTAQLSPDRLEYYSVMRFIKKCMRPPVHHQTLVAAPAPPLMQAPQSPPPAPTVRIYAPDSSDPEPLLQSLAGAMSVGMQGRAIASIGHSVVITLCLESDREAVKNAFTGLCSAFQAATGCCGPFVMTTGSKAVQVEYASPGAIAKCQEMVAPEISQACILILDPLLDSSKFLATLQSGGASVEPTCLVLVTGSNLTAATLHAHAAGQYIQLHSAADDQLPADLAGFSEVSLFVCPSELLKEEQIVLEACWEGAWSHPVELPLLAAMSPDNLDSIMAACPAEKRQELEERLCGLVGGFPDDSSDEEDEATKTEGTEHVHSEALAMAQPEGQLACWPPAVHPEEEHSDDRTTPLVDTALPGIRDSGSVDLQKRDHQGPLAIMDARKDFQPQVHGREQEEGRSGTLAMSRQTPPAQSSKEQAAKSKRKDLSQHRERPSGQGQRDSLHEEQVEVISPADQRKVHIQEEEQDIVNQQVGSFGQASGQEASAPSATTGHDQVWDVFISHRGADKLPNTNVKKTFVSFLHVRLQQTGIRSFMNEHSLEPGEQACEAMLAAVRQCRIAIPVLSESYGNSIWCLRELTAMVEATRHVMPLFLDDSGHEVLQKIKAGSRKLAGQVKPEELQAWRRAIEFAGSPTGWRQVQMSGYHASLVDSMVEHVVSHLGMNPLPVPARPAAMDLQPVLQALEEHRTVGLYGMGGIGKTSLANAVFNQLQSGYVLQCCYVDVGRMAAEPAARAMQIESCQRQMLKDLCGLQATFHGVQQKAAELERRLSRANILLVLDDIWSEDQLKGLLVKLGSQSKVIVTSRDQGLLQRTLPGLCSTTPEYVEIQLLSRQDSQLMLCLHAFGQNHAPAHLAQLAKEAANACGGLPSSLSVVGSYLAACQDPQAWRNAIYKLQHAQELDNSGNGTIFARLRVSYDFLDTETQDMLMEIACGLLGQPSSFAACAWGTAGLLRLEKLKHLSLISVKYGRLVMHDQVRDMLQSLANPHSGDRHACWYHWDQNVAPILSSPSIYQLRGIVATNDIGQACLKRMPHLRLLLNPGIPLSMRSAAICSAHFLLAIPEPAKILEPTDSLAASPALHLQLLAEPSRVYGPADSPAASGP
ncbi:hypothetical protein WJX74_010990 [Apatococcus lobatus]|uniref:TIR domain-containing protein n=1 Tax=Apatococcus lobatus TaxID=904363 RepID=A0AAW1RT17_9CHLO